MISSDKKQLAVFGKDHHYVIETTPRFLEIMDSPYRSRLRARFELLRVEPKRNILVFMTLGIDTPEGAGMPTNAEIVKLLVPAKQAEPAKDATAVWSERLILEGHRYGNTKDTQVSVSQKLNQTYKVSVYEDPSSLELDIFEKSPVTLARKVVGAAIWLPIFVVFQMNNM